MLYSTCTSYKILPVLYIELNATVRNVSGKHKSIDSPRAKHHFSAKRQKKLIYPMPKLCVNICYMWNNLSKKQTKTSFIPTKVVRENTLNYNIQLRASGFIKSSKNDCLNRKLFIKLMEAQCSICLFKIDISYSTLQYYSCRRAD